MIDRGGAIGRGAGAKGGPDPRTRSVRWLLAMALWTAGACARPGFPEGGPVDTTPPTVATTVPQDKAIDVPAEAPIEIVFGEPLAPGAEAQVRKLLVVNPDEPETVTSVEGEKIKILPKGPLEPRTTYAVLLRPGVPDRRSNLTKEPVQITFSTGGPLTLTLLKGSVTMGGKPAPGASILARNLDRNFGYHALADSTGAFDLTSVALGRYEVAAWTETNGDLGFQYTLEPGDTASATLDKPGTGADLAFTLVLADTSAPRLARVEPLAKDALTLTFSDTLARDWSVDLGKTVVLRLPPEVAPRGTPLDSIPPASIVGDTIPVAEARRDTLQPKDVVLRIGETLADSTAYAVRLGAAKNTAGLVAPDAPPFELFRTRAAPDTSLKALPEPGAQPAGPATPTPPGAAAPSGAPGASGAQAAPGPPPAQVVPAAPEDSLRVPAPAAGAAPAGGVPAGADTTPAAPDTLGAPGPAPPAAPPAEVPPDSVGGETEAPRRPAGAVHGR